MIYFFSDSKKDSLVGKKGFFRISKPVLKLIYTDRILKFRNTFFNTTKPFLFIEKIIRKYRLFAAGFISYDYGNDILGIKYVKKRLFNLPDIYVVFFKDLEEVKLTDTSTYSKITCISYPVSRENFILTVNKAKEYISRGDIYQINLSMPIIIEGFFNKKSIFNRLIDIQPTPYMMLILEKRFSLISGSMELFLKKEGNKITTKPIKGTRPRGKSPKEDDFLRKELYLDEKERAENLMITDLMRNDLGKISKIGSIKAEELFKIESYNHLFQMHSTISGILKDNIDLDTIVKATFPPGSVTGAPKKRAMEIISELEEFKRSVYCGATFFITPDIDFVMSVAIRQIIFQKNLAGIYVGSGIVADSVPEKEYEETLLKAKANIKAIQNG